MAEPATLARLRTIVDIGTGLSLICASGLLIWVNWPVKADRRDIPLPSDPISLQGAAVSGSSQATVVTVMFSDFQCPYCGRFARETLPRIRTKYVDTGKISLAFRHLPIETLHPFAPRAAEAALCATRQGQFDRYHDALFADQKLLDETRLSIAATAVGLNVQMFSTCLTGETREQLAFDVSQARALEIRSTPTFLVGRMLSDGTVRVSARLSGSKPFAAFEAEFEKLLASRQE